MVKPGNKMNRANLSDAGIAAKSASETRYIVPKTYQLHQDHGSIALHFLIQNRIHCRIRLLQQPLLFSS